MNILVVGATGFIGSHLIIVAHEKGYEVKATTRRESAGFFTRYDLLDPLAGELPGCDVAFLCAGVADYRRSEGNAEAWRTNVDGNIACAKRLMRAGAFVVFPSSVAAEWAHGTAYGRAKVAVELFLQAQGDPAIVRFDRVTRDNVIGVCGGLLRIGASRQPGVFHL